MVSYVCVSRLAQCFYVHSATRLHLLLLGDPLQVNSHMPPVYSPQVQRYWPLHFLSWLQPFDQQWSHYRTTEMSGHLHISGSANTVYTITYVDRFFMFCIIYWQYYQLCVNYCDLIYYILQDYINFTGTIINGLVQRMIIMTNFTVNHHTKTIQHMTHTLWGDSILTTCHWKCCGIFFSSLRPSDPYALEI